MSTNIQALVDNLRSALRDEQQAKADITVIEEALAKADENLRRVQHRRKQAEAQLLATASEVPA